MFTNKKGKKFYRIKCSIAGEDGVLQEIEFVNLQVFYDEPNRPGGLETEDRTWAVLFGQGIYVIKQYPGTQKESQMFDFYKVREEKKLNYFSMMQ